MRKSGYVTPCLTVSRKDLIKYDLFVHPFYDDWQDYRDSFRDWFSDFKKIKKVNKSVSFYSDVLYKKRLKMNTKQKKLVKRRKWRKWRKKTEVFI